MVSFLIDGALAVLLVTATVYLVVVNKRLKLLRTGQSEINALVSTFSRSIDDTDASMKRLVTSATEIATRLSDELDRAKGVKEDMTLILGSCERTATRMEESVQHARALLRRLDEGAMQRRLQRPVPVEEPMPAADAASAPSTVPPAEQSAETISERPAHIGEAETGDFRPLDLPSRPASSPAPSNDKPEAPAAAGPEQRMAAGAFYARLRTIGSEG